MKRNAQPNPPGRSPRWWSRALRPAEPPGAPAWPRSRPAPAPLPLRWSAKRKAEVVLRLLRGEALDALSRQTAVPVPRLEDWRQQALVGVEQALQIRVHDDPTQLRLDEANRRIGELSMEVELLRARCEKSGPFAGRRSRP